MVAKPPFVWRQLHWPRPLEAVAVLEVLRAWAADERSPRLVLEARGGSDGVAYLLGAPLPALLEAKRQLRARLPEVRLTEPSEPRHPVRTARRLSLSTRHRPLRTEPPELVVRGVLGALSAVGRDEELVLQTVLGPRRVPLAIPNHSPSSVVMPWWQIAWIGNGGQVDGEKRAALRAKVADHGFAATVRLGVSAQSADRRRVLLLRLYNALRLSEAPGVRVHQVSESPRKLHPATRPWLWPLRLGVAEVLSLSGWPLGDESLPGMPAVHPKLLPPVAGTTGSERVVAVASAPGIKDCLALPAPAALHHMHLLGPTGTGKSTLLVNLIGADIEAGRAVIVVDPQGDLVTHVLERVPPRRRADVVVLDPADTAAPVGLNPLLTNGQSPEVVADGLLAVFRGLYGDGLGPRSQDILHSCLLTLTQRPDASLIMLPLLLTNAGFRRSLTNNLGDPIALGPFWQWYEHLSEAERQAAIAPIQNKLRQWLLRPSLRNVLGQRKPNVSVAQAMRERQILLVSLAQSRLGPEGAALLGSLVVSQLWQATTGRERLPPAQRHPVMVYLDEFAAFLHLPTDLAEALARSRGMGVGYTLAHQFLAQLSPAMRSAVLANARSRVCFQLSPDDAATIARSHPELVAEDLTSLGRYEVYASLFANGQVTPFASGRTLPMSPALQGADEVRALSRQRYGQSLDEVEASFAALIEPTSTQAAESPGRRPRRPA